MISIYSCVCLAQWFSDFGVPWKHLEGLLKHTLLGPTLRVLLNLLTSQYRSGVWPENLHLIYIKFPGMLILPTQDQAWRTTGLADYHLSGL